MCARILVIDDDPVNLDLMTYLLNAFGHTPIAAESATEALEVLTNEAVDLILCDIQMPSVDGFEFLRRLKPDVRKAAPVIGVTALAMVGDREKILAAGFDGYMAKPITPETFVADVEKFVAVAERRPRSEPEPAAPHAAVRQERRNIRVLAVDNEAANLEIMRIHLDYGGYEVSTASSGNSALEIARTSPPDVIVSDIHMPDGDGFSLIQRIRSDPRLRAVPVIFVSATAQGRNEVDRGISLGAYKFLIRPFEPEVLLEAVASSLKKSDR